MGTSRPRDRREQILTEAGTLFRERGYPNVSVSDVAEAVGVGPSSLYRHFRNKSDLLRNVVHSGLDSLTSTVTNSTDLTSLLKNLSATLPTRRGLPLLWQREARHLPEEDRSEMRHLLHETTSGIAALIRVERPGLSQPDSAMLAWAVLAVFGSVSGHRSTLPHRHMEELLFTLAESVARSQITETIQCESKSGRTTIHDAARLVAMPRREALLTAAIRLFDERGYRSVNNVDIGEAIGTTGPNIYNYFETKVDILTAAVNRGNERRTHGVIRAVAAAPGPEESLLSMVRAHIDFALENYHLIGVLTNELDELPPRVRKDYMQNHRDFIEMWTQILGEQRPDLSVAELQITVFATLTIVENLARTRQTRTRPDLHERLVEMGHAVLLGN
ncbi:TetR/AcrR family transcriptional regulator [Rhodococcus sp. ARC_M6]|uniref:TetR/AcrR family transcriptional regulator n=1 Tax=Rhodococcus sp. ARC_M6 TaxID=2928852 RepID=UPI001FB206F0|nr:TetR/AcrR family transcriptional regulator [Rhodococcus sp. ARC_M6]MCJ0907234.1 TetR/AcrR family transcriptional regulator [Rhodococcus sp. ARC_M6]